MVYVPRRALRLVLDFADSLSGDPRPGLPLTTSPSPPGAGPERPSRCVRCARWSPHWCPARIRWPGIARPRAGRDPRRARLRAPARPPAVLVAAVAGDRRPCAESSPTTGDRSARFPRHQRRGLQRLDSAPRRPSRCGGFPLVRGLYDLVFGYEDGDLQRPALAAGVAVFLTGIVLFQYKGAHLLEDDGRHGRRRHRAAVPGAAQARRRVRVLPPRRRTASRRPPQAVDAITMGRQARLADGVEDYEPLSKSAACPSSRTGHWPNSSRRGTDRDDWNRTSVSVPTSKPGCCAGASTSTTSCWPLRWAWCAGRSELIADRPEWRDMTTHLRTVATQAFQMWLRPDEPTLGWHRPGVTTSGYLRPSTPGRRCRRRCGPRSGQSTIGRVRWPTSAAA